MSPSFSSARLLVTRSAAAAAMLIATFSAAPLPAQAEVVKPIDGLPAECVNAGNQIAQYKCGSAYYRKLSADSKARSAAAKTRGAAADARAAVADGENACLDLIMSDLKANGTKTANLAEPPKKGEACRTAKALNLTAG